VIYYQLYAILFPRFSDNSISTKGSSFLGRWFGYDHCGFRIAYCTVVNLVKNLCLIDGCCIFKHGAAQLIFSLLPI
jgi:hypothetical protein